MATKKRRILYVDATIQDDITKISLYDIQNNLTNILELYDITKSIDAEQYAIIYAILYIVKNDYDRCHILCDNLNATQNKNILELAKSKNITISWIPREINVIAVKIVKLEPTIKIQEWYILDLFYKMLLNPNTQPK
jgi:hypothetical protein